MTTRKKEKIAQGTKITWLLMILTFITLKKLNYPPSNQTTGPHGILWDFISKRLGP